jgi:hypothetical protein
MHGTPLVSKPAISLSLFSFSATPRITAEELCGMGSAVLADPQGQTRLPVAGVHLSEVFNNALDVETTILWSEPRRHEEIQSGVAPGPGCTTSQELARRAAVAVPGGQAPGITINGETLRLPQLTLQPDNQGASASGSSEQQISTEVSAGTNLMMACRAAYCICLEHEC